MGRIADQLVLGRLLAVPGGSRLFLAAFGTATERKVVHFPRWKSACQQQTSCTLVRVPKRHFAHDFRDHDLECALETQRQTSSELDE